ncbi:hypothetical protein QBC35DRAFT_142473 [Podospora australis]|uniref:Uncharacterized protein n=1 Tax=Podospora australis TaxID=1536484 RepID=A0AAN7AK07_9PEZI|nr:hypothetical protein QBC35DRAFT_142473 [Podospora australis]
MVMIDTDEVFFVYENRLASFQIPHTVETTETSRAPQALHWPHKTLSPVAFAKAGFFFEPYPQSPDNVVCFLCDKSLDGWEPEDNPLEEHLKHSPTCGWAIMAAIEAGVGNYKKVHPLDPFMMEARKATFAGRWPYESKRGFKSKIKKLVEAGWKYTPSREADDMATCAYCQLALEGWESDDNPWDEHHSRSPNCPFFALVNQQPAPKKAGRAKAARASAASRLSLISVATVATSASDIASLADVTADHDDSVLTTASTMTQGGKKTKAKKPPAKAPAKGRKTKAKKDEAIEILEDEPKVEEAPPPPPPKPTRGRKRASDEMEESVITNAEAPAPKKRATRTKKDSAVSVPDADMTDAPAAPPKKKGRAPAKGRKVSQASVVSRASTASAQPTIPDDDEIERQLQADLERYNTEDEHPAADSETERQRAPAPAKGKPKKKAASRKASTQSVQEESKVHAMFDPTPVQPDEEEIEAEYKALEAQLAPEQPEPGTLVVPKKGRKPGTRKVSKAKKAKEPTPQPEPVDDPMEDAVEYPSLPTEEPAQQQDELDVMSDPDASTGTVVTKSARTSLPPPPPPPKRGRGRPSKKSLMSQASIEVIEPEPRRSSARVAKAWASTPSEQVTPEEGKISRKPVPAPPAVASAPVPPTPVRKDKSLPPPPPSSAAATEHSPEPPTTPPRSSHATRSANQAAISPSQSPQTSDAENQVPSSKPSTSTASIISKRVVLVPVASTPLRTSSPSRRNAIAGLQSATPWQPVDLDLVFTPAANSPSKENGGVARLLRKEAELSSPEKRMTVEEWIYHNASLAEQMLKHECETMVSAFEREGSRAMRVLEDLVVE